MSLYIGNLPPGIHRDDIESVFRRFGRCSVRLHDGYAFAVYDFRPNAEKALRALKGRSIFGAPISLFWSNQQPKTSQRFTRGGGQFEMHRRRNFNRVDDLEYRRRGSESRQNLRMSYPEPDNDAVRLKSSDTHDERESFRQDHGEHHDQGDELLDIDGSVNRPNQVESNRWGKLVDSFSNETERENGGTFDRYEPDVANEIRVEDEKQQTLPSDRHTKESAIVGAGMEQVDDAHRDDQLEHSPRKRKPYLLKHRGDDARNSDKGEGELGRSRDKLPSRRHSASNKHREANKRASVSGKYERVRSRTSTMERELRREKRKGSGGKRRLERDRDTSGENHSKKARRSLYSARRARRSRSPSRLSDSIAGSGSHSRSRSLSPESQSSSSSSRPRHKPRRSRSASVNSRTKSSSSSHTSLSLSVSLGRPLPSPPNKAELDTAGTQGIASNPVMKGTMIPEKKDFHEIPSASRVLNEATDEGGITVNVTGNSETNHSILRASSEVYHASEKEFHVSEDTMVHDNQQFNSVPSFCFVPNANPDDAVLGNNDVENGDINHVETTVSSEIKTFSETNERSDSEAPSASCVRNLDLSPEELRRVLQHYGFKSPEESEPPAMARDYFGACRLWPWEIIYFRKLKKGPISIENYARRVSQNKEFGIVDKYIRSSSGWGQ